MKDIRLAVRFLLISLLTLATASPSYAATSAMVIWLKFPTVSVKAEGTEYTGVTAIAYGWEAEFEIESGTIGRTKSWRLFPILSSPGLPAFSLHRFAASKSYRFGARPKRVHKTVGQIFPNTVIEDYAIQACNRNRDRLRDQGVPDGEIFSTQHQIPVDVRQGFDIDVTIGSLIVEALGPNEHQIICLAREIMESPPPPPVASTDIALPFQVTGALLLIVPGHKTETECPTELGFIGRIFTAGTGSGTVQYRFEWPTGERSTVFSVEVEDGSEGVDISHQVEIPLTAAFAPGDGDQGGGSTAVHEGGIAETPQAPPPEPLPEVAPEQPEGPTVTDTRLPANVHKSDVRLVVLSHGGVVSDPESYHIVCQPSATEGIDGPGGITTPVPNPESGPAGSSPGLTLPRPQ